jgi:4-amino-4-deoxy-L-arabinose transferase-like glycosyltransferase
VPLWNSKLQPRISTFLGHPNAIHVILAVGLIVRVVWCLSYVPVIASDADFYYQSAVRLAQSGQYVTSAGTPTAYFPVGYPLILSCAFRLFGSSTSVVVGLQLLLQMGTLYAFYRLLNRLVGLRSVSNATTAVLAIDPNYVAFTTAAMTEASYIFLITAALRQFFHVRQRRVSAILSGLLFGLATLERSETVLIPLILGAAVLLGRFAKPTPARLSNVAVCVLAMTMVLTPWLVRNAHVTGVPLLATNGGKNLYMGNNDHSNGRWEDVASDPDVRDIVTGGLSEEAANRAFFQRGTHFILLHPVRAARLYLKKLVLTFGTNTSGVGWSYPRALRDPDDRKDLVPMRLLSNAFYYFALVGVAVFGFRAARCGLPDQFRPYVIVAGSLIVYFALLHALFIGDPRFKVPVVPFLFGLAALGASEAFGHWRLTLGSNVASAPVPRPGD